MGGQNFAQGSTDAFVNAMTQASQSHGQPPPTAEAPSGQLVSQYIGNVPSLGEQGLGGLSDLGAVNWGALLGKGLPGLGGLVGSLLGGPFGGIVGGLGANALAGLLAGKGLEGGIAQGGLGLPAAFASQAGSGIGSAFGPFGALAGSLLAGNLIGEAVAQGMAGNLGEAMPSGNEGADFSLPAFEPGAPIVMSPEVMDAVGQMASMEPQAAEAIQPPPQYSLSPTPFGWYGMKRVGLPWKSQEPGFGGNYGGMKRVNE